MKAKKHTNPIVAIVKFIDKMIAKVKAHRTYNKEVKERYKAGTRKVSLFTKNPLIVKNNFLARVTDITREELAEFNNYVEGKGPSHIPAKETARARITPLPNNRLWVEFFNAKGLPTYDFTITKTVIKNAFEKNLSDKTIYVVEQKRGNILRFFKKDVLAKKATIGFELDNVKRDVKKNKESSWLSLRYKTHSCIPAFRTHRFTTNMNAIKQSGFTITNTVEISQTQFEYIKPKSRADKHDTKVVAFA